MTFGAMASWQAWLLVGGAAGVATALFLLKLRPPRMSVPSLLVWRWVLDDAREQTLWERIRRAVSLAVTIVIAVALALAAARLSRGTAGATPGSGGRMLVVIDSSWSMLAKTSTGETRWERAVAQARRLSAASGAEVAVATTADGIVEGPTGDRALTDAALHRITPSGADATSWPSLLGTDSVHFITDGAIARPLVATVVRHSVFEPAPNVAITAFTVRPSLSGERAADAYLEIANYAAASQRVRLALTRGTASLIDRTIDMGPGEALRQVIPIARGAEPVLRARVSGRENALEIDDEAFAWTERSHPLSLVVVGEDTGWLTSLFERDPTIQVSIVAPARYPGGTDKADVIVFDRWSPREPPPRPALYFAPPRGDGTIEERPRWERVGTHPVVLGVDPLTLTIDRARRYSPAGLTAVATSNRGTPLVSVSESPETRSVVVSFSAGESNLASAPGFPVLVGNALDWLSTPSAQPATRRSGLALFDDAVSKVTDPRGGTVPLIRVNGAAVGALSDPGLYIVQGGGSQSTIAINAGGPQVSDLTRTTLVGTAQATPVVSGASQRPWWVYCALAAFVLVLAEWWTWQRRITV